MSKNISKVTYNGLEAIKFYDSYYIPNYIKNHKEFYQKLNNEINWIPRENFVFKIFGHIFNLPRDKAFIGDKLEDDYRPLYRYGDDYTPDVVDWTEKTTEIRDQIEKDYKVHNNHLVANRYLLGKDHIGFHVDKTKDFAEDSSVFTTSFGGERTFRIKKMPAKRIKKLNGYETENIENKEDVITIVLKSGSLFILGPKTNKFYKHSIVKTSRKNTKSRISLTMRNIKTKFKKINNKLDIIE